MQGVHTGQLAINVINFKHGVLWFSGFATFVLRRISGGQLEERQNCAFFVCAKIVGLFGFTKSAV